MSKVDILAIVQVVLAVLTVLVVLMQQRGSGIGSLFGGSAGTSGGEFYRARRGFEKFLFYGTIVLGSLLVITSFLYFFI